MVAKPLVALLFLLLIGASIIEYTTVATSVKPASNEQEEYEITVYEFPNLPGGTVYSTDFNGRLLVIDRDSPESGINYILVIDISRNHTVLIRSNYTEAFDLYDEGIVWVTKDSSGSKIVVNIYSAETNESYAFITPFNIPVALKVRAYRIGDILWLALGNRIVYINTSSKTAYYMPGVFSGVFPDMKLLVYSNTSGIIFYNYSSGTITFYKPHVPGTLISLDIMHIGRTGNLLTVEVSCDVRSGWGRITYEKKYTYPPDDAGELITYMQENTVAEIIYTNPGRSFSRNGLRHGNLLLADLRRTSSDDFIYVYDISSLPVYENILWFYDPATESIIMDYNRSKVFRAPENDADISEGVAGEPEWVFLGEPVDISLEHIGGGVVAVKHNVVVYKNIVKYVRRRIKYNSPLFYVTGFYDLGSTQKLEIESLDPSILVSYGSSIKRKMNITLIGRSKSTVRGFSYYVYIDGKYGKLVPSPQPFHPDWIGQLPTFVLIFAKVQKDNITVIAFLNEPEHVFMFDPPDTPEEVAEYIGMDVELSNNTLLITNSRPLDRTPILFIHLGDLSEKVEKIVVNGKELDREAYVLRNGWLILDPQIDIKIVLSGSTGTGNERRGNLGVYPMPSYPFLPVLLFVSVISVFLLKKRITYRR